MAIYVVDSNFFIQAHRAVYPLDIAKGFWNSVKNLAIEEKIVSIDKVKKEIYKNNDELKGWCKNNLPENFFRDSSLVLKEYSKIISWANSRSHHYLQKALNEFMDADEADAFLVAYALSDKTNRIVVHKK